MGKKLPFDLSKLKKIRKSNLLIALLAGILFLVINLPTPGGNDEGGDSQNPQGSREAGRSEAVVTGAATASYKEGLEHQLTEILSAMEGVGEVQVMITLRDAGELVVEKDVSRTEGNQTDEDSQGTRRSNQTLNLQEATVSDSSSSPFISREVKPRVEGVLVVAQGGGTPGVAKNISDAVLALFPIELHKIKVVKAKN